MPREYVRAKIKDEGTHVSILRQEFENHPDAYTELKQAAVNENGDPLPPKLPESPVASGQTATTQKES